MSTDTTSRTRAPREGASLPDLWRDVRSFILARPPSPTVVRTRTLSQRWDLSARIHQRVGLDVTMYSILNVHRIGVEVPPREVFARLMTWDGDSPYWPNHLVRTTRMEAGLQSIELHLFGLRRFLGVPLRPLFRLTADRIVDSPGPGDPDSNRYVIFSCRGGYPIGHFIIYVRSPIAERGEKEPAQLFFAVGFNVYGSWRLGQTGLGRLWASLWTPLHNRVTGHVLHRIKALCERKPLGVDGSAAR